MNCYLFKISSETETRIRNQVRNQARKGMLSIPFLFLCLCLSFCLSSCHPSPPEWGVEEIETGYEAYDSTSLFYPTVNPISGLSLEFVHGAYGWQGYVNVYSRNIPHIPGDPSLAKMRIVIDNAPQDLLATRMSGGQRLALSPKATEQLMDAFNQNLPVSVLIVGFEEDIQPANFPKLYKKIK